MRKSRPIPVPELLAEEPERVRAQLVQWMGEDRMGWLERHGFVCGECMGSGIKTYPNTTTWRGGVGGQALTPGVCDGCWGSGTDRPWPSHRLQGTREEAG